MITDILTFLYFTCQGHLSSSLSSSVRLNLVSKSRCMPGYSGTDVSLRLCAGRLLRGSMLGIELGKEARGTRDSRGTSLIDGDFKTRER
jgi:hypothetical protein